MPSTDASNRAEAPRRVAIGRPLVLAALGLSLTAAGGCAGRSARGPVPVAVTAVDTMGVPRAEGATLQRALLRELRLSSSARPVAIPTGAAASATSGCRESEECLAELGRRAAASLVLSSTLAGLGDMRMIRARLVRSSDALIVQDLQETVAGGGSVLDQRAADLVKRLFPERGGRSWYRRWWVWVTAGAVVGATAGLTTWMVLRGRSDQPQNLVHLGDL
jgi:hypothetical protein